MTQAPASKRMSREVSRRLNLAAINMPRAPRALSRALVELTMGCSVSANGAVIVSTFVGIPIVTLAHELGHAAAGLKFTKNPVLVRRQAAGTCDPAP